MLALVGGVSRLSVEEALALAPPRDGYTTLLLAAVSHDDLALVNACLELEAELRERAYQAVERLCARLPGGDAPLDVRVRRLPPGEQLAALGDLYAAGWVYDGDAS